MKHTPFKYEFGELTTLFHYAIRSIEASGFQLTNHGTRETMQIVPFSNEKCLPWGAVQYEGSRYLHLKKPTVVSIRFYKRNIPSALQQELNAITLFRRDKNKGPSMNKESSVIAFKLYRINEKERDLINVLYDVLKKYAR